jgi:predicted anti-sigma-YlaC factor YlaD
MTGMADCREIRQALGVYVLGAIDPAERALVDTHLPTCADCREELVGLAGLPAMLHKISAGEAERLVADEAVADAAPSAELLHSLLARATEVKRSRRWRGLVAAAAVVALAVGGGAVTTSVLQGGGGTVAAHHWHTVSAANPATGAHMVVKYTPMPWGTLLSVRVEGLKAGTWCQFEVTDARGHRSVVGSWRLSLHGGPDWYPASTGISDQDLRSFELTDGHTVLATVPAA